MRIFGRRATGGLVVLAAVSLALAGCGSNSSDGNGSAAPAASSSSDTAAPSSGPSSQAPAGTAPSAGTSDSDPAALLPSDVKAKGTIVVAMDGSQGQPFTFFASDNTTMEGLTVDLANALGDALGLKFKVENTSFDALIPGLQAKRYDLTIAPMLMTPTRLASVDMIGWLHGGSAFLVMKSGGPTDVTLDSLCGKTVGAQTGSVEAAALDEQTAKCTQSGKSGISIKLFPHATDGVVALTAGRIEVYDTAAAQAGYMAESTDGITQSGEPYNSGTSSMALQKDSPIAKAVTAALQKLIDDGTYKKILDKYGVGELAVPSASLNAPV